MPGVLWHFMNFRQLSLVSALQRPGYEKIEINPETGFFSQAEGQIITPKGMVTVSWKKQGEKVIMDVKVPNGISYYCNGPYN